jgi:glycosyltransferase involved in cell wall biosynthesis
VNGSERLPDDLLAIKGCDVKRVFIDGRIYGMQAVGGIGRVFTELLTRMGEAADEFEFLLHLPAQVKGDPPKGDRIRWFQDARLRPDFLFRIGSEKWSLSKIRRECPAIYHSTYYSPPPWPGMKTVVMVHDFIDAHGYPGFSGNPPGFVDRMKKAIEAADQVVAVSESTRQDILRFTDAAEDRVTVVHHGVSAGFEQVEEKEIAVAEFRQKHRIERPYWLHVGRRKLYKNFGTLLRAWVEHDSAFGEATDLVCIGPNEPMTSWQIDFLTRHRLLERLKLLSNLPDRDLAAAYGGAKAFVSASIWEGFGIPLLEAMACQTPILCSDIAPYREVAGEAAEFFDPHDPADLARVMAEVSDGERVAKLKAAGGKRIELFSWAKSARQLAEVYRRTLEN